MTQHEVLSKGFALEVPYMLSRSLCLSPVACDSPHVTQVLGTRQTPPVAVSHAHGFSEVIQEEDLQEGTFVYLQ